eukprot:scaffold4637_cov128-Cylindrotheca_fusiformis.AAC.12
MKATREQFGEEAARKAAAKDMLAKMLPWDTRDKERDILVDECKEAILALSNNEETFFGPFEMPRLDVNVEDEEKKKNEEGEDVDEEEDDEEKEHEKLKRLLPSEESLEKLAKLEPLPPLLQEFDLDCHVGLIQMLLKEDPKLVEVQSKLSGKKKCGGPREKTFWRNYFFHCAYTRYEAGLSIDEIWSFDSESKEDEVAENSVVVTSEAGDADDEEQVVFQDGTATGEKPEPVFKSDENDAAHAEAAPAAEESAPSDSGNGDYDFLDDGDDLAAEDDADNNPELDELEAEILKELED